MARERIFGLVLLSAGVLLVAGATGDIINLMSLPEVIGAIAGTMRDHGETLKPAGYLVAGGGALIAGIHRFGS